MSKMKIKDYENFEDYLIESFKNLKFQREWEKQEMASNEKSPEYDKKDIPDFEHLNVWLFDGTCEAIDGCIVEPDGHCHHGKPSWLLELGYI